MLKIIILLSTFLLFIRGDDVIEILHAWKSSCLSQVTQLEQHRIFHEQNVIDENLENFLQILCKLYQIGQSLPAGLEITQYKSSIASNLLLNELYPSYKRRIEDPLSKGMQICLQIREGSENVSNMYQKLASQLGEIVDDFRTDLNTFVAEFSLNLLVKQVENGQISAEIFLSEIGGIQAELRRELNGMSYFSDLILERAKVGIDRMLHHRVPFIGIDRELIRVATKLILEAKIGVLWNETEHKIDPNKANLREMEQFEPIFHFEWHKIVTKIAEMVTNDDEYNRKELSQKASDLLEFAKNRCVSMQTALMARIDHLQQGLRQECASFKNVISSVPNSMVNVAFLNQMLANIHTIYGQVQTELGRFGIEAEYFEQKLRHLAQFSFAEADLARLGQGQAMIIIEKHFMNEQQLDRAMERIKLEEVNGICEVPQSSDNLEEVNLQMGQLRLREAANACAVPNFGGRQN